MSEIQLSDDLVAITKANETDNASGLRSSSRERVLTEKGSQYQIEILIKDFKSCLSKRRRQSVTVSVTLSDASEPEVVRRDRANLENVFQELCATFDKVQVLIMDNTFLGAYSSETFDRVGIEHQQMICKISEKNIRT